MILIIVRLLVFMVFVCLLNKCCMWLGVFGVLMVIMVCMEGILWVVCSIVVFLRECLISRVGVLYLLVKKVVVCIKFLIFEEKLVFVKFFLFFFSFVKLKESILMFLRVNVWVIL